VCFPHAGGNASAYVDWPAVVGGGYRVVAVRPPGRHERFAEEPCGSISEAANAVADEIARLAPQRLADEAPG
jgi:pyochelin biosynthetic protein PchC